MPVPFNCSNPDVAAAREILLEFLIANPTIQQLDDSGGLYKPHVIYEGGSILPHVLAFAIREAFWQLLIEGIVVPGKDPSNDKLPWFHVTDYGKRVLTSPRPSPYDPDRY